MENTINLCDYEIRNIISSLNLAIQEEHKNCKWERQADGRYWYTPNKRVKQLRFTIRNIERQIKAGSGSH